MPKLYPGYRDEIRKKIISEAFSVFLSKGFEKTTMDDIAARLGVTKPAIYRYYRNKEDLFLASMAETMMGEFKSIFATSFASGDLLTGAGLFFDGHLAIDRKYAAIRKDMDSIISRNASLHEGIDGFHSEGMEFMRHFFEEQKKNGTIRTTIDDQDLVLICGALVNGLITSVSFGLDPVEAKRLWLLGFGRLTGIRTGRRT